MSSFVGFFIFATALVLVHGQEYNHRETVEYHEYTDKQSCTKREYGPTQRNGSLSARERLVTLKAPPGFQYFPRSVPAKRCNGHCPALLSPMPTEWKPKTFTVHLHLSGESMPLKCVTVTVNEHMACKCMCMVSAENCSAKQEWNEANCNCPCRNREIQKAKCEANPKMMWNDADCTCICPRSLMHCKSGEIWDVDVCRCVKQ